MVRNLSEVKVVHREQPGGQIELTVGIGHMSVGVLLPAGLKGNTLSLFPYLSFVVFFFYLFRYPVATACEHASKLKIAFGQCGINAIVFDCFRKW